LSSTTRRFRQPPRAAQWQWRRARRCPPRSHQHLGTGARLPTIYPNREYLQAGGLISYGANFSDLFRHAADFVDKILHGAKPGGLPVEQPTKFELVINLTVAKALGLKIPEAFLLRADELIE
jgi:putative ABC transport system substrate-binding protein